MFSNTYEEEDQKQGWKSKQIQYKKESARKDRQLTLQSQRYLNFSQVIEWRMNLNTFKTRVQAIYNYYTLLSTLFAISQEANWRHYIGHMNLLISTFHNIMCSKNGSSLQDIKKIKDFEYKFQKLFLLKDLQLHKHLMMLLKMLLALNSKYMFMKETTFSEILVQSATHNDVETMREVLWILSQIQVSNLALIKIFKLESLNFSIQRGDTCLLPLLSVISNFMSNDSHNISILEQLVTSSMFQKVFQMGLSSNKIEIINETILIFNNGICISPVIRNTLLNGQKIVNMIMSFDCPQKFKCQQILTVLEFHKKLGNQNIAHNYDPINSNTLNSWPSHKQRTFQSSSQNTME